MFGQQDVSAFDTLDYDKHRQRREPWNPYFSKQSVSRLQPLLIQAVVNKLCMRLAEYQAAGKPINMVHAFACVTANVVSDYSFPQGYNLLTSLNLTLRIVMPGWPYRRPAMSSSNLDACIFSLIPCPRG